MTAAADEVGLLERLYAAHADAAAFFRSRLVEPGCVGPRSYLTGRGLGHLLGTTRWEVGYAPAGWTALTDHLRTLGYGDSTLVESGLCLRSRHGGLVDRFRDRVTAGIHSHDGDLVGFIGRAGPDAGDGVPKYLNSPHTPIYDKGAVLHGLGEQRDRLAAGGLPVLVEGPLDVLAVDACNRPGLSSLVPVAPCGTALTETHTAALGRCTSGPVVVAFDADDAGRAAAARAYPLLAAQSGPLQAAGLPGGSDPADLLATSGPAGLRAALASTRPLADVVLDDRLEPFADRFDNAEACVAALRAAALAVAGLRPGEVAVQAARLTTILGLDPATVSDELAEAATRPPASRAGGACGAVNRGPAAAPRPQAEDRATGRAVGGATTAPPPAGQSPLPPPTAHPVSAHPVSAHPAASGQRRAAAGGGPRRQAIW